MSVAMILYVGQFYMKSKTHLGQSYLIDYCFKHHLHMAINIRNSKTVLFLSLVLI